MTQLLDQLARRVLFMDGAMGTAAHEHDLSVEKDYRGRENCTEILVQTRPDVVQAIHESFLAVGSDAVETNTFGANKLVLAEFDLTDQTRAINAEAAQIARAACRRYESGDKPRFVVGSMGPGTKLLTLGDTTWDDMFDSYLEQALGLIDGDVDALLLETAQDILQVKSALCACLAALEQQQKSTIQIPILVQLTIETTGTMLVGTEISAAATTLAPFPILSLGLNCATGPAEMSPHVRWLSTHWDRPISVQPNAGLPVLVEGRTEYPLKPELFAEAMLRFVDTCGVRIVGGCCGTTPQHIAALIEAVGQRQPGAVDRDTLRPACTSLYSAVDYRQDTTILNIGERTNASGSRAFKRMLEAEDWDGIVSLARGQVREGSHVIDLNVDYAGRDNAQDMAQLVSRFVRQVNVPLMLDSTQPDTIEAGLKRASGKCLINSANLEDGEEEFARMCALARRYGAGLVIGCIDEDPDEAMARTADRKEAIARRMHDLAVNQHGLAEDDLIIDPLVLPISTGMDKDRHSGLETIEGTRRIAQHLPRCQITCGLSNVSFGLKPAARVVLNSAFLHELVEAGMTSAIHHASKILPRNKIPTDQWQAALELIYDRRPADAIELPDGTRTTDPLTIFVSLFSDPSAQQTAQDISTLPLEERLQRHIIDGEKQNLVETLDEALEPYGPLAIINDHLLAGMKVVGVLFGSGQMQLPFVLQSAEVMKMAVSHLEPHMEKLEGQSKGTIVLATVRGDVHDIGKNLVDIILTNNGYTVHNLGIKQPIDNILTAWREHGADAIGLSGLLVKSVKVMEENLYELNEQANNPPVLLGGAALSRHYCESHLRGAYQGSLYYGKDAFEGLAIMEDLMSGRASQLDEQIEQRLAKRAAVDQKLSEASATSATDQNATVAVAVAARSDVATDVDVPEPPFWGDRVCQDLPLDDIYPFVNRVALYRGQWQFKKGRMSDSEYEKMIEEQVDPLFDRLAAECRDDRTLRPGVVWGYFPCASAGDDLILYDPNDHDRPVERFTFPRQAGRKHLCISDFFRPADTGPPDVLGLVCVTMGPAVTEAARSLFESNQYSEYLYLHGFGVECAEALAELWHQRIRRELGIGGEDATHVRDLFTQKYRGSRYSFGYPACPDVANQEKLFRLLDPKRIGCTLTENWQIDPEQSTSAIVVHHPEARYFSI